MRRHEGAILAKLVNKAEREGRINDDVVYDPNGAPIEVTSDLGFHDTASWWYWQRKVDGFSLLYYDGESGWDAQDWIQRVQYVLDIEIKAAKLGRIWLPHDAKAKTFQSKHSSMEQFLKAFGSDRVAVVPQTRKEHQINAARTVIAKCEFHKTLCEAGIDGLLAWEFSWNEENNVLSREPVHNWASHPSDAFAYGCQMMEQQAPPAPTPDKMRGIFVGNNEVTLNEMWATLPSRGNGRI